MPTFPEYLDAVAKATDVKTAEKNFMLVREQYEINVGRYNLGVIDKEEFMDVTALVAKIAPRQEESSTCRMVKKVVNG